MKKGTSLTGIFFLTLFYINGCKKETQVAKALPVACFTQSRDTIISNSSVTFTNCSTGASSYSWNFGDGRASYTDPSGPANIVNVYAYTGTYKVQLTATNADGSNIKTDTVFVGDIPGTYSVSESCGSGPDNFTCTVTANSPNGVTVSNFGNYNIAVSGYRTGYDLNFPSQVVNGWTVSGTGGVSADLQTLIIFYHITNGSTITEDCSDTGTRM